MISKHVFVLLIVVTMLPLLTKGQTAPAPVGPVPNARQIEWYHREIMAFFHFGINTFTDTDGVNEGDGTASPTLFNPTALDCSQWMRVLKAAGIPCGILVAKHADGFCNWPTAYTTYCLKNSPWKGGKGDVVKEYTDACHTAGIKAAIYLGPNDRHESTYGTPAYATYYANQLSEVLRGDYGTIWHLWWDGAGADQMTTAFYTRWHDTVQALQPDCSIFGTKNSYPFADSRWVGNESGTAGDPCWSTINRSMIQVENTDSLNSGEVNGTAYVGAEVDVSIRPSWFYHHAEDGQVKSLATLQNIYFNSVGHNCVWLLNFPPDRRGLISRNDSLEADSLGSWIYGTFHTNLAGSATVTSLHPRGAGFAPANLVDTLESTYYAAADGFNTDTITFNLGSAQTFDVIKVQEVIQLGHRTTGWSVDYSSNGTNWTPVPGATGKQCIGYKWLVRITNPITASYVRLRITAGKACPAIHSFGLYKQQLLRPVAVSAPSKASATAQPILVNFMGNTLVLPAEFKGKSITLAMMDLNGRVVDKAQCLAGTSYAMGTGFTRVKSGLYFIKISMPGEMKVQKFINVR
jgi:alpha-L-fucosidase